MGYAFINIKDKNDVLKFYNAYNQKKWELFKSKKVIYYKKICEIKYAKI